MENNERLKYDKLSEEVQSRIIQDRENGVVNPYKCNDSSALRRDMTRDKANLWRPAFVRDAEKILHLPYYNRYADKTQVFSFYNNDDITRRALHVQLVSRIARNIGAALGLNLDLIEAIALGHDIGRLLVKECGFENEVRCVLSDGLEGISQNDCSDISICGMGAELIVKILSSCSWTENKEKHFIFNPMTHSEILRRYLCENGFEIQNDIIVKEGNRYYNVLDAYYTGDIVERSEAYYYLGEIKSFEHKGYFYHLLNYLENKEKGGADNQEVICAIKKLL